MDEFEMSDLGMMHYFLGIEVVQSNAGIFISQKKYVGEILYRFHMQNCNSATTPAAFGCKLHKDHEGKKVDNTFFKQIVGSLMYLTATRPDIMYFVSLISRKGTKSNLLGFTDSDFAENQDDRRSTSGYAFMFRTSVITWSSKKQPIVTLSSTEAELVAATACTCQAI
ncbi:uncharacterized protein LOC114415860 [Glycine soja]|uniref:uncharacterized protein LOC114415860 n=1 Tax=Glycine soja TaxID=3848 RepID=UPI00103CD9A3|nr:uncharacterized protein LOC114415860 [Glycine soja]